MYLRNNLTNLQRAAAEGYPIKGYFLWSLLDNFEWSFAVQHSLRSSLRGLQDAKAHAEAECGVVSRSDCPQRAGLAGYSRHSER